MPASAGGEVAFEQGAVDLFGGGAQGAGERAVRGVVGGGRVARQRGVLLVRKSDVAVEGQRDEQGLAFAPARRSGRRRERGQAGQAGLLLSVQAMKAEDVQVNGHGVTTE
ncbi:MAG: hypothetical protein B6D40_06475 [Anaerolineae bacterium UTCFX3]|nr:MAG: hypothetical protein B6D40_06475 [Anaerolineae bacterium UTCFX3]